MKEKAGQDENGCQLPIPDEIYRIVMPDERHGRVRGEGLGVTPTAFFRSQTASSTSNSTRINDLEHQVSDLKRKLEEKDEEMERRIKERDDEYERRMKARDEEIERQNVERKKRMMDRVEEMLGIRRQPL
ncbi:hypothetical protein BVC80_8859g18 [Macleaya cordata]|uniref:Uncharacterized protein n=1 Tax=Macleaya cordata TaxID=56857 RepID=A0A200PXY6_MACCD|nr:hypothetical protein BVC80_8859g18 [Macleaya cordata]